MPIFPVSIIERKVWLSNLDRVSSPRKGPRGSSVHDHFSGLIPFPGADTRSCSIDFVWDLIYSGLRSEQWTGSPLPGCGTIRAARGRSDLALDSAGGVLTNRRRFYEPSARCWRQGALSCRGESQCPNEHGSCAGQRLEHPGIQELSV